MKKSESVEEYMRNHPGNAEELKKLRSILVKSALIETVKWGAPTYTLAGKNVVSIVGFKGYTSLWFHQGIFLNDPDQVLVATDNDTKKALRQWKFINAEEINENQIIPYVQEAIDNEKKGKRKAPEKKELHIPDEFLTAFTKNTDLKVAFYKLTSGRQREYADYVASAKREITRIQRVEKCIPLIRKGSGLNDAYRK